MEIKPQSIRTWKGEEIIYQFLLLQHYFFLLSRVSIATIRAPNQCLSLFLTANRVFIEISFAVHQVGIRHLPAAKATAVIIAALAVAAPAVQTVPVRAVTAQTAAIATLIRR